jgi:hypothetical protein
MRCWKPRSVGCTMRSVTSAPQLDAILPRDTANGTGRPRPVRSGCASKGFELGRLRRQSLNATDDASTWQWIRCAGRRHHEGIMAYTGVTGPNKLMRTNCRLLEASGRHENDSLLCSRGATLFG